MDRRPDPDQILNQIQREEAWEKRGKLKIFLGYAAGVGKTYAMLDAARRRHEEGHDVVVGYIETHGRAETDALLAGLEILPRREIVYRDIHLTEMDTDAILKRRPQIALVDELAHTNVPGSRHTRRYQDVEELLNSGINVYTTVNIQHLESLNDVVNQVTGVIVHETIPDNILDEAHEIELIDLPIDELLGRLEVGKIYLPAQAEQALRRFFRPGNLTALREMALRRAAERIDEQMRAYMQTHAIAGPWPAGERLLVCVGPSPTSAKVIRAAKRLADRLHAPWIALHIESSSASQWSDADRQQLQRNLKLAESLGGELVQASGDDVSQELLAYASSRNVTKIVVGKTGERTRRWWRGANSLVDRMLRDSGNMDVVVVRGVDEPHSDATTWYSRQTKRPPLRWLEATSFTAVTTLITLLMNRAGFSEANLVMVYLLAIVAIAARCGSTPSIAASVASVVIFDLLFTQPYYRITVYDSQYLVTFAVMLIVGLLASTLTSRIRYQADTARRNERRAEALYRLSRRLANTANTLDL